MYTNRSKWIFITFVVIAVVGMAAFVANAQTTPTTDDFDCPWGDPPLEIVAELLGMDIDTLIGELQAGSTVAELAAEQGIELDAVVDAVVIAHTERMAAAVEAGWMTQEQVDARLEVMQANLTTRFTEPFDPQGYGEGWGMGYGYGMMQGCGCGMMGSGMMNGNGGRMGPGMMNGGRDWDEDDDRPGQGRGGRDW